jgi:hypothetical protein
MHGRSERAGEGRRGPERECRAPADGHPRATGPFDIGPRAATLEQTGWIGV